MLPQVHKHLRENGDYKVKNKKQSEKNKNKNQNQK